MSTWLKDLLKDVASEIWTFVGLFSAWLVLTGSAKTVIGDISLGAFACWVISLRLRNPREKE